MFARSSVLVLMVHASACGGDSAAPTLDAALDAPEVVDARVTPDAPPTMQPTLEEEHVYVRPRPPFATVEECEATSPDLPCVQSLVLCPGGDFTLRLTDVVNAGGYALRPGDVIQALRRGEGDGPQRFSGVIDASAGTFTSETEGLAGVWTRERGTPACL